MSAAVKKQTESKFVSCFADSRPDVDITFRDVLLSRPTDHYLVGVDNFSMTNTSLSMIEPQSGDAATLVRIVANRPHDVADWGKFGSEAILQGVLATDGNPIVNHMYMSNGTAQSAGFDLSIKTTDTILSVQQLMHRLGQLAADTNEYMNTGHAESNFFEFGGYVPLKADGVAVDTTQHLKFELATDGRLSIMGTRAFWSCFSIEVPSVQYQFGFFGPRRSTDDVEPMNGLRRYLSLHPTSTTYGATFRKILVAKNRVPRPVQGDAESDEDFALRIADVNAQNRRIIGGIDTQVIQRQTDIGTIDPAFFNTHGATASQTINFQTHASLFSTMERRVALEVGCSLPIKNSPMVDHQKETPDFVLGRWIWRTDPRIECNDQGGSRRYSGMMPACTEYQGAKDRVTYHELQPQAKIQTLRIKLFARVRTFDENTETWSMRVIALPTASTDWWHSRIHFISKD